MNTGLSLPNVVCNRCGVYLFSWDDVLKHWEHHKWQDRSMEEHQKAIARANQRKGD